MSLHPSKRKRVVFLRGLGFAAFLILSSAAFPVWAVDVPFRFQVNNFVYEGVAKLENGHLTGNAAAGGGNLHLDGKIKGDEVSVEATGNFAPGLGMGSNLLATGSSHSAIGQVSLVMAASADKDYGVSLRCDLS